MGYLVTKQPFGSTYLLKLQNSNTGEFISVLPECGAAIQQICLSTNTRIHHLLWETGDATTWFNECLPQYQGALLCPFVDRIENGKYLFEGKHYVLPLNEPNQENAIHGLLYNKVFELKESYSDNKNATVLLRYNHEGNITGYPFLFSITVLFCLSEKSMNCSVSIQNEYNGNIPVGIGWHPYFQISKNHSEYEISIPAALTFITNENHVNTGKQKPFSHKDQFIPIDRLSFNVFELSNSIDSPEIKFLDKNREILTSIRTKGFSFLQVYVLNSRGIAIEPATCIGNAFNNGMGLKILSVGEVMKSSFSLSVRDWQSV